MINIVNEKLKINVTPLEELQMDPTNISLYFDDSEEVRWKVDICPYQAVRVTTIDCIDTVDYLVNGTRSFNILEVIDSNWVKLLKQTLSEIDETANFLDKSHHYVFPFQDLVVEIVCWDLAFEKV
ncbi:MAG: hypothetical protein NAG76_16875 [Candidatus Pristimantibacillus lignocellulolyticus]|uniref:Uncharacterized protein n=1 Tax=Candidatus Pristimantibacillus lignocellulolyticus TaxID=2994561 RepID=A0A9J6ZBU1_9BACL|nr:MAG: hypothetical protein NAG76_16875 [Candidatus Pristimantibacillus lignocellulolyticus]